MNSALGLALRDHFVWEGGGLGGLENRAGGCRKGRREVPEQLIQPCACD